MSWSPGKMKLSRATHSRWGWGGGASDGKDTLTSSELRDIEGSRDAGTVREIWKVWMERHK